MSTVTYVVCSIFHSILVSRHKFHSCIVRELYISSRKLIVRIKLQTSQDCNDISMTHKFHSARNLNCKQPVSNRVLSNDVHKCKSQFRDRNDHGQSSRVNICKLVGHEFHNLLLASQLYRSIDRKRNFHDQSKLGLDNQLLVE